MTSPPESPCTYEECHPWWRVSIIYWTHGSKLAWQISPRLFQLCTICQRP